jgi:hypothetical protein
VLKLGIALSTSVLALALPASHGVAGKTSRALERTLLHQMNSTPDGRITRKVDCAPLPGAPHSFTCRLTSVRSTSLRVDVDLAGGGFRAIWYPLAG